MDAKLVVLISGNGSNLQAIIDACNGGEIPAKILAVISNSSDAFGLKRAEKAGIGALVFPKKEGEPRRDYDKRLADKVASHNPDFIILAGWMRLLSSTFLDRFAGKVINLHPALPGMFEGTNAIERAYRAWQNGEIRRTGVMIHFVPDEGMDNGPVLATKEIFFTIDETFEEFEDRVHKEEHELLILTLKEILLNRSQ